MARFVFDICGHWLNESCYWTESSVWPSVDTAFFFSWNFTSFGGGGVGQALGRKSSPGSVGRKFGGVGAVISSGGALFLLLPEALAGFGSAFGSLWMMNPYLSCHLESSLSFLTLWKLGLKLRWNWGLTRFVFWLITRATLCKCCGYLPRYMPTLPLSFNFFLMCPDCRLLAST